MSDENENNLVQRAREDRRTLEKMRRKLATSGHMGKNDVAKLRKPVKRNARIWPFAAAAVVILLGLNFALSTRQDQIMALLGVKTTEKAPPGPPAGASLDEQVRFWAYALYDVPKLKARFHVPRGTVVKPAVARTNLEQLLAENLGSEVRNEVFAMQQKAKAVPATGKIGPAK
jgi:hypothetical protein